MPKVQQNTRQKRTYDDFRDGFSDHLTPLKSLDLSKIKNFSDLTSAMEKTAFGGRTLGEAVDVLVEMARDKDTFVVMTLSGAMTVGKMGLIVCDMIEKGMVNAIVSTGALMAHGLIEAAGLTHFKVPQNMNDLELCEKGYDRVYDTLELENNFNEIEKLVFQALDLIPDDQVISSRLLHELIGKILSKSVKGRGMLKSAYLMGVPIYVPAFTDSELGLDMGLYNRLRLKEGKRPKKFDPFLDLEHYSEMMMRQKKWGIFTIGGGVPRNWAQQVGPYLDLLDFRHGLRGDDNELKMFDFGVRICPDPPNFGHLSGCTYSEGMSWQKMDPNGKFVEVLSDATIAWPLIAKASFEKLGKKVIKKRVFAGEKAVKEIAELVDKMYSITAT